MPGQVSIGLEVALPQDCGDTGGGPGCGPCPAPSPMSTTLSVVLTSNPVNAAWTLGSMTLTWAPGAGPTGGGWWFGTGDLSSSDGTCPLTLAVFCTEGCLWNLLAWLDYADLPDDPGGCGADCYTFTGGGCDNTILVQPPAGTFLWQVSIDMVNIGPGCSTPCFADLGGFGIEVLITEV